MSVGWSVYDCWLFHFEAYSFNREWTKAAKSKKILFSLHSFLQQWHTWCKHWGLGSGKGPARLMLLSQTYNNSHCSPDCEYTRFGACRKENNPHPTPLLLTSHAPEEKVQPSGMYHDPEQTPDNCTLTQKRAFTLLLIRHTTCLQGASVVWLFHSLRHAVFLLDSLYLQIRQPAAHGGTVSVIKKKHPGRSFADKCESI